MRGVLIVQRSPLQNRLVQKSFWLTCGIATLATSVFNPGSAIAQTTTLPSNPNLTFQTSGPARCANIGDWYTTNGTGITTPGGIQNAAGPPFPPFPGNLCVPGDPALTPTTNATANRIHRFLISVTPADLAAAGGQVTVTVQDAGTGGSLDEVDGANGVNYDPTRFQLLDQAGNVIGTTTLTPFTNPADIGRDITFPPITQPGVYTVTSLTGEYAINGYTGVFNPNLNNDDNGFRVVVTGVQNLLIGQFQGTFQNTAVVATNYNFFLIVGPGTNNLFLRNFDLDAPADPSTISYTNPTNATIAGTTSGNAVWNGGTNDLNNGGDSVPVAGLANAGRWQITLANYGGSFTNQSLLEANSGTVADPAQRLPVFDTPPTRAGNFVITPPTDRRTQIGQTVCHEFQVINNFFTTDIINLATQGTDPNYTVQFRDAAGTTPLTDTDGDGRVDTGILASGETRTFTLCVTPQPGAPPQDNTQILGTSFLDQRIRQQAVASGFPGADPNPTVQTVLKRTFIDQAGSSAANLLLVKRITNVTRNGAVLPGVNFGTFIDDPGTTDDNDPGWSQIGLTGILALPVTNPVQSGDEVTYTVYFLSRGSAPAIDASICDLIPGNTTFVLNSSEIRFNNNNPVAGGDFFTPLAPLPPNNSCTIQTNPNGALISNLGTVSNVAGSNFGFIRFRVRVN